MQFTICQQVRIIDMNDELISETLFEHGTLETINLTIGCSVITHKLGLKEFNVVTDRRYDENCRYKITDIEYSLISQPPITKAYLEPITLIVGQHDVGSV